MGFPGSSVIKNLPANAGDTGDVPGSLGGKDPLEKGMAPHSSILAWKIPWTEPGGLQSMGVAKSQTPLSACTCTDTYTHTHTHTVYKCMDAQGKYLQKS